MHYLWISICESETKKAVLLIYMQTIACFALFFFVKTEKGYGWN